MPVVMPARKRCDFDPHAFLATIGEGESYLAHLDIKHCISGIPLRKDALFIREEHKFHLEDWQGSDHRHTGEGDFFGEGSLAKLSGWVLQLPWQIALFCESTDGTLHREHAFPDLFVAYLLGRNIRYEEDLVDQLFNSSEKRLARVLPLLAHFGKEGVPDTVVPKISQETLAEMVGTPPSRASFFMNRFRKLGFVNYDENGFQVRSSLLNVVLHD
jgi:CRP/FNR family cyclic AMP-dependent transcriptional regulator